MVEEGRLLDALEEIEKFFLHSAIPQRFKVLFLFLPSYEDLKTLWRILQGKRELYAVYRLEEFLKEGKNWLSVSDLQGIITRDLPKKVEDDENTDKLIFLFSLGEFLKFYTSKELEDFLIKRFTLWENLPIKGVIVPIVGGKEQILSLLKREPRHLAGETKNYLLLEDKEPQKKLTLYLLKEKKLTLPKDVEVVNTLKDFLKTFYFLSEKKKVVYLKKLISRSGEIAKEDRTLEIKTVSNYKDIVRKLLQFEEEFFLEPSEEILRELIPLLEKKKKTYSELLKTFFNDLREEELIYEMVKEGVGSLKGWLIANYLIKKFPNWKEFFENFQPSDVVLKLYKSPEVERNLKRRIFKLLEERGSPLISILCTELEKENPNILLGILSCEREIFLKHYADGKIDEETLKDNVKEVSYYLRGLTTLLPSEVEKYLEKYKRCKLKNRLTEELKKIIVTLNGSEESFYSWYSKIPKVEELLAKYPKAKVYLLDAVGGEWLGFIVEFLKEIGFFVKEYRYAVAELPTITEVNIKVFERSGLKWAKLDDLDRLIHTTYEFPRTIIEEFETVKKLLKRINSPSGTVIITADHGSTALSRLAEALNLKNCNPLHGGRYCEGRYETEYTLIHEEGGKTYTLAKFHNSLGRKPNSEVHGGALPEEVLVPFVVLSTEKSPVEIISPFLHRKEIFAGEPLKVELVESANAIKVELDGKPVSFKIVNNYLVVDRKETKKLKEGLHSLKISFDGKSFEIPFVVKRRLKEKDLGLEL